MKRFLKLGILTVFLLCFGFSSLTTSAESVYEEFNQTTTKLDKEWTIEFSQEVSSPVSIINENVRMVNSLGEEFPIDETKTNIENTKVTVYPKEKYTVGETYTLYVESGITSKAGAPLEPPAKLTFKVSAPSGEVGDVVYDKEGTYNDGTINGNVTVSVANVTLNNMVIEGDLIVSESVGDGEVYFNNVDVKGETRILGGGKNSVYFENSTLATVIVNKNTGAVRIVVKGDTSVEEVSLESSAILQEEVTDGATGFKNVQLQEAMRNSDNNVELIGTFETINVYAVISVA